MTAIIKWNRLVSGHLDPLHTPFSGEISEPGIYAVSGPNGCGKSSLMRTMLGLQKPLSGAIQMSGIFKIGYVPQYQKTNQFFHVSVREFVGFGFGPESSQIDPEAITAALTKWDLISVAAKSFHRLSGGQKTRAVIARALIANPDALFLDEPLASLDACCQKDLMDTLHAQTHERRVWAIMIDHHFEPFQNYIKETIHFHRAHDAPVCSLTFSSRENPCCP